MALTSYVSYAVEDYAGKNAIVRVFVDATATLAEIQSMSDAMAAELDPITDGKIVGATVNLALTLPGGLKASAVAGSDINRGINWAFTAADTTYGHTIRTPAPPDAIVDGEAIVPNADTNDWITACLDGDAVTEPSDEYANDLTAAKSQKVTFHK